MSATDSGAGCTSIWLVIYSLLSISLAAGGGCLIAYIFLPKSQSTSWLPFAGVTLVCVPWLFWFLTFLYRVILCVSGLRVSTDCEAGGGGKTSEGPNIVTAGAAPGKPPVGSPGKQSRRVQFGDAVVAGNDQNGDHGAGRGEK